MKKYTFSCEQDAFYDTLRQFRADECIKRINRESVDILQNPSNELCIAKRKEFLIYQNGKPPIIQETIVTPWDLIDMAYYIIIASDDYNGSRFDSEAEFNALYFEVYNYLHQRIGESSAEKANESGKFIIEFILGALGEQLKFQRLNWLFDNMYRDMHILLELNDSNKVDVERILEEKTGISSWKTIIANLVRAWEGFKKVDTLGEILELIPWNSASEKEVFIRTVEMYTANYDEVRSSNLRRQIFYKKPFIKTQKGEVVSVNTYLILFLCEHSIYWIVRDYCNEKYDKQFFPNHYGHLFEKYFKEVLKSCVSEGEFIKIEEEKTKRADWKLEINEYRFLIEQKSSLMRLEAKQQIANYDNIMAFMTRAIISAITQLDKTEKEINKGKYIKVILLYEDYIKAEMLDYIMESPECSIDNDRYYWLVSIREMEMLLYLAKSDRKLFREIVSEKISREERNSKNGRELMGILMEKGVQENHFIREMPIVKELLEKTQDGY